MASRGRRCLMACGLLCSAALFAAEQESAAQVQDLLLRWTGLERQRDALRDNWRRQEPVLEQRLLLLERERQELRSLLENSTDQREEVEARRLALLEEQTLLEQQQTVLERSLNAAAASIERIHSQLPPPLEQAWRADMRTLREERLEASERLQLIVNMLTALHDFDNTITLREALMEMEEGGRYAVTQVFVGLSQGWYVNADGSRAGYGRVTPQGWRWQPGADSARVNEFIDIVQRRQAPALLSLPVTLSASTDVTE